ncbi:MAG: T9SS type A sorting domain-containing protein, partial [Ignavibacteria bacterium]|nr:T9SS type A sorting domain-containing protein [Ignavibacteria bacterium]
EQSAVEYQLLQNYPNPFNPITTIGYTLPDREHVRVAVMDILGQEIAVLTDGIQEAGEHIVQWDAREMASGVYFYKLNAGRKSITRKMLLVR